MVSETLLASMRRRFSTTSVTHGAVVRITVDGTWPELHLSDACTVDAVLHPLVTAALVDAGFVGDGRRLRTRTARAVAALGSTLDPSVLWPGVLPVDLRVGPRRRGELFGSMADRVDSRRGALVEALHALSDTIATSKHRSGGFGLVLVRFDGTEVVVEPHPFDVVVPGRVLRLGRGPVIVGVDGIDAILDGVRQAGAICVEAGAGGRIDEVMSWQGRLVAVGVGDGLDQVEVRPFIPGVAGDAPGAAFGVRRGAWRLDELVEAAPRWWDDGLELVVDADTADLADMAAALSVGRPGLYPHQDRFCATYAATDTGVVCAMPPGSGKTAAACVALQERSRQARHSWLGLVVAPAACCAQWRDELARWGPGNPVDDPATWLATGGVHVVADRSVSSVLEQLVTAGCLVDDLVVDEANGLHRRSARSVTLWALRGTARRAMALTGTPKGRSWGEVVALCEFARNRRGGYRRIEPALRRRGARAAGPAVFVDAADELEHWARPVELDVVDVAGDVGRVSVAVERLADAHGRLTLAAGKANAAGTLQVSGRNARQTLRSTRLEVLNASRALVRAWALATVEAVVDHIAELEGPTLVFCDDRQTLDAVVAGLGEDIGVLDGRTAPEGRDAIARSFQSGTLDVLCVSRAGSVGLNLQRARHVVFADLPFNPSLLRQRIGRAVRGGNDGSCVTVTAFAVGDVGARAVRLLARGAVAAASTGNGVDDGADELAIVAGLFRRRR